MQPAISRRAAALPAVALVLGLALVYAPVLREVSLYGDDYTNLVEGPPVAWIVGAAGRPVQYVLLVAMHRLFVATGGDVLPLRLLAFGLSVALALALFAAVRRGLGAWGAVALVLFTCSAPAYLVTFGWLSVAVNLPAFLAAAASYATGYTLMERARSVAARAALGVATVLLVAAASLTYQIAVELPLALVVYHLVFERDRGAPVRRAVRAYALFGAGLVLSLVTLKVVLAVSGIPIADRAQSSLARLASARGLLLPLRMFDMNFALHYLWWGWLTREAAIVLGVVLSLVLIRVAWRETRGGTPEARDARARWALVLAALGAAGMLFSIDASRELRTKPFLTLLVLLLAIHAIRATRAWARAPAKPAVVAAVVLLTMWSGRGTLADGLLSYTGLELARTRDVLAATAPGSLTRVHVIQPRSRCFTPPCYGNFEFALKLASSQEWVPRGLVRHALLQLGRRAETPEVTFSPAPPPPGDPAVVVDLGALADELYAARGETLDVDRFLQRRDLRLADVKGLSGFWLRIAPHVEAPAKVAGQRAPGP